MTNHDSEKPAHGQQVITACAFIHHNFDGVEKVFLPRRAATKKFLPGVFELPGGHINFGEEITDGLAREIKEEFQMDVKIGDIIGAFTYTNEIKGSHSVEIVYFAQFTSPLSDITLDPAYHSEFIWFDGTNYSQITNELKGENDIEHMLIKKGFALLQGERLQF